jgi:hypothetical protein
MYLFKNKIIIQFCDIFVATKKVPVGQQIFYPSSFVAVVGSGIPDRSDKKIPDPQHYPNGAHKMRHFIW